MPRTEVLSDLELMLLLYHNNAALSEPSPTEVSLARNRLHELGLIEALDDDDIEDDMVTTERGEVHVDYLRNIDLPERRWVHE